MVMALTKLILAIFCIYCQIDYICTMEQKVTVSPRMREVADYLIENCEGIGFCIKEKDSNIIVEVSKADIETVTASLQVGFDNVAPLRLAHPMLPYLHRFILVKPMVSEAPLVSVEGIPIPTTEKELVDSLADWEYENESVSQKKKDFQHIMETQSVHIPRLMRYAARKGKKDEISALLEGVNQERVQMVQSIRACLACAPVSRAWMFGSYARMEEQENSDIDLLVSLDQPVPMGLFGFSELVLNLEQATGKTIDLVVEGTVKPFAKDSIERDKVLIYERA